MKLALKLAYKNLIGAGLRTWLNVGVLSFVFVVIIFYSAFLNGWQEQARIDGIEWEYGNGQLQNMKYDPYDTFSIPDGHGILSDKGEQDLVPILIRTGTMYPDGRMVPILIKGIEANQNTLKIPSKMLSSNSSKISAVIGNRMVVSTNLKVGDDILIRWRDKNGTFDAANITIVGTFNTTMASIDNGQVWISLENLQQMTGLVNQVSYFVAGKNYTPHEVEGWNFRTQDYLLKSIDQAVGYERVTSIIINLILLVVALLAIFDTQVLSIFRRQKEIGIFVALGMTRKEVVMLFTVEGSMYALLATIMGAIYGIPIFLYTSIKGISLFSNFSDMGIPLSDTIHPLYSFNLIVGVFLLVVISATLVSLLPAYKISKMNIVNALKGKIS